MIGDAGKVRYDFYANQVETYDLHSRTRQVLEFKDFDRNRMFLDEVIHLLACLRGQAQPLVDLREATRRLRIFLLADTSLRTGAVVTCDW